MMFSLDDESLEKGGEAILASRGDLGAAALLGERGPGRDERAGSTPCARRRKSFYRPRAKTTELAEKKRALEALKDERDKADTLASTYAELSASATRRRRPTRLAAESAGERRARAPKPSSGCSQRLPHLAALREAESESSSRSPACRRRPAGWDEEAARLQAEAIRLDGAERERRDRRSAGPEDELERIGDDPAALAARAARRRLARIAQPLRHREGHSRSPGRARRQTRRRRRNPAPPRPARAKPSRGRLILSVPDGRRARGPRSHRARAC